MSKLSWRLMLLVLGLLTSQWANAYDFVVDSIYYNITNASYKTVEVTHGDERSYSGELVIPEKITNGGTEYSVTGIGDNAFYYCWGLMGVTIPNSVISIGNSAFGSCPNLTSVNIPNSVTSIGDGAFSDCRGLTSVHLGNSVMTIGDAAFSWCSNLTSINIPNSIVSIGTEAFDYSSIHPDEDGYIGPYLASCKPDSDGNVTVKEGTRIIGSDAFRNSSINTLTLPSSLKNIGIQRYFCHFHHVNISDVAAWCMIDFGTNPLEVGYWEEPTDLLLNGEPITKVVLPEGTTRIGRSAFRGCKYLTNIYIPESVTEIAESAFTGCYFAWKNFENKSHCTSDSYWGAHICDYETADGVLVENNTIISSRNIATYVDLPNTITSIGTGAFRDCSNLVGINIPNSVTGIGMSAFENCSSLADIIIPNSVDTIWESAFANCNKLINIIIPSSVKYVGHWAFEKCELRTVVSKQNDPSDFYDAFSDLAYTHATLYVPEDTYWDYVYNSGWGKFIHIKEMAMEAKKVKANMGYMLADEQGCNYTVYDSQKKQLVTVPYTHALDEEDAGSSWAVVETAEGGKALFNLGARMYAAVNTDGKFSLSSVPVTLSVQDSEQGAMLNGHPTLFVLNRSVDADVIKNIVPNNPATGSDYYTLDGKKASPWQKGVLIKDGRKVVR